MDGTACNPIAVLADYGLGLAVVKSSSEAAGNAASKASYNRCLVRLAVDKLAHCHMGFILRGSSAPSGVLPKLDVLISVTRTPSETRTGDGGFAGCCAVKVGSEQHLRPRPPSRLKL